MTSYYKGEGGAAMSYWSNKAETTVRGAFFNAQLRAPSCFEMLRFLPESLSEKEWRLLSRKLFFVVGDLCSGKDTLLEKVTEGDGFSRVAETKTRELRPEEVPGRHINPVTVEGFLEKLLGNEFLVAYMANPEERCQLAGIETVIMRQVLEMPGRIGMITHPAVAGVMSALMPIPVFVVWSREHESFKARRGGEILDIFDD
ncbi:MAG TPA: hypothetical protein PK263_00495, partial [bacterium]|nr:hypothetical protein [bacterium]